MWIAVFWVDNVFRIGFVLKRKVTDFINLNFLDFSLPDMCHACQYYKKLSMKESWYLQMKRVLLYVLLSALFYLNTWS